MSAQCFCPLCGNGHDPSLLYTDMERADAARAARREAIEEVVRRVRAAGTYRGGEFDLRGLWAQMFAELDAIERELSTPGDTGGGDAGNEG